MRIMVKETLYHLTHARNVMRVLRTGLRVSRKSGWLWFATLTKVRSLIHHVARHHGWDPDDMRLLRCEVTNTGGIRPFRHEGIYRTRFDIPAEWIRHIPLRAD